MARGAVVVSGEVVDVETRQSEPGAERPYFFYIVTVIAGKSAIEVRWDPKRSEGEVPKDGEQVALDVELGVYGGRLQVNARRRAGAVHVAKPA